MAESVVSSVAQTIGKLLVNEAKFLWGVEGKVKDLQKQLELIQCFLRDADMKQEHDQAIRECVSQLQDIAYDAEDVIERYILRVTLKQGQNIIEAFACFMAKCMCVQAYVVGIKIDGLKSNILNLRKSMRDYNIQPLNEGECKRVRAPTLKRTFAHVEEEDFFGREDSFKLLVKELLKDREQLRVISICGMGGLGKTTLAKKVFTHDKVKNHFEGFAWACISLEYHMRDILEGILIKLIPDKREGVKEMREDELLETIYMNLKKKRCIVVLDDIWTKQAWDSLQAAFPVKDTRSKLLITTRNEEVAKYIDPHCLLHEPRCLSDQESWVLLKKRVSPQMEGFALGLSSVGPGVSQGIVADQVEEGIARQSEMEGQRRVITEEMKKLGDELLKKCGGLPLAIIVLGGLLANDKWEIVYRNINLHFRDKTDLLKVLAISYYDLPWHLKPCFLYLGSFPEDAKIPVTSLFHMWIAEGFVLSNACDEERENAMEDVAEQYLMELVKRGLVQVQRNLNGNIKTCHLHDLMRNLCVLKARQHRFLSFDNIQQYDEREGSSPSMAIEGESTCKIRRLSLNMRSIDEGNVTSRAEQIGRTMPHIRTLMFFHFGVFYEGMWEQFQPIFINCKFLRVLKLNINSKVGENLPESIGDLVHLRFLSLAGSMFQGLPQSIGNLVRMKFLDLLVDIRVRVSMPNVLWKLRRLRYLRLPYHYTVKEKFHGDRKKLRLGTLTNLRALKNFDANECDVNDVGKMTNLQKLSVSNWDDPIELEIFLQLAKFNLEHLRSLSSSICKFGGSWSEEELSKLANYPHSFKLHIVGHIEKLPEHKSLPQQLSKLLLIATDLEEDPMPILEKLPHLVVLELMGAFPGKEMVCSAGGFPKLKHLVLEGLYNLKEWRVAEGAMPHLSQLNISECPYLTVPEELSHVCTTYNSWGEI